MSDIIGTGIAFPLRVDRRGGLALCVGRRRHPGGDRAHPRHGAGRAADAARSSAAAIHDSRLRRRSTPTTHRRGSRSTIRDALDRWEPRIEVLDVDFDLSRRGDGVLLIDITYQLRATNDVRNLVYPFYVIPAEEPE